MSKNKQLFYCFWLVYDKGFLTRQALACGWLMPGFLKLLLMRDCMCVCARVYALKP